MYLLSHLGHSDPGCPTHPAPLELAGNQGWSVLSQRNWGFELPPHLTNKGICEPETSSTYSSGSRSDVYLLR